MSTNNFKHDLLSQFARIAKAMSNANRLELLDFLAQGERSVESLSTISGLSVANTSQHLQQLRQAGLIEARKQGLKVFYRVTGDDVIELLSQLRQVAENRLADVDRLINTFLTVKDELEPVASDMLLERVRDGLVTIIDVRPAEEYAAGHVAEAINVPLDKLDSLLDELPDDREIVAYCRGPHCILAYDAVQKLRQQGRNARRLEGGYPEWRVSGLPVVVPE